MKKFIGLLFILSVSLQIGAKVYYFSPTEIKSLKEVLSRGDLQPGDQILLRDGIYKDLRDVLFHAKGTAQDSIILKAEHLGKAIISGALGLRIYGEYLQIEGIRFHKAWALSGGMIDFQKEKGQYASHCRITQCAIDDCNDANKNARAVKGQNDSQQSENWIGFYGWNNRVDHCYFAIQNT